MTPSDAARALLQRRNVRGSLEAWCRHALAPLGQAPAAHHKLVIHELENVARGLNDRLAIFMPRGTGKSVYASKLFPPWFLGTNKNQRIVAASGTLDFVVSISRDSQKFVRDNSAVLGYDLERESVENWTTTNGGEYVAVGAGGQVVGRRADLLLLDDVVAGRAKADSPIEREKIEAWYRSDALGCLKPGGRVILIMTRYHEDDLAGRILREFGDDWRVISLPAIAEQEDMLGRKPGDPLWPGYQDIDWLKRKRREVGEREWQAQYMQRPSSEEGSILRKTWWKPWTDPVPNRPDLVLMSLDNALTEKKQNAYSALTVWNMITPQRIARPGYATDPAEWRSRILLRYAWQERLEFPDLVVRVLETAEHFKVPGVPFRLLVEGAPVGIPVIQELRKRAPSLNVWQVNVSRQGDKVARAHSVTALMEAGKIWAIAKPDPETGEPVWRPWAELCINQCAQFPLGETMDMADSVTMALRHMRDMGADFFFEDESPTPDYVEPKEMALY